MIKSLLWHTQVILRDEVESRREEVLENMSTTEECFRKDVRRYMGESMSLNPTSKVSHPHPSGSLYGFRPIEELSPGEISENINPQEFEDWLDSYESYLVTGVVEGAAVPERLKVWIFI